MLREVRTRQLHPRLQTYVVNYAAGVPAAAVGRHDLSAQVTDTATGRVTMNFKKSFSQNLLVFATRKDDGDTEGYIGNLSSANNTTEFRVRDGAGNLEDASFHAFVYGFYSSFAGAVSNQFVRSTKNKSRIIYASTGGDGVPTIGLTDFSLTAQDTGDYTYTFLRPFAQAPVVCASVISTGFSAVLIDDVTPNSVHLKTYAIATGAAEAAALQIIAIGQDSRSEHAGLRDPLRNSQRKPRMLGFQVDVSASALAVGANLATVASPATGRWVITFNDAFARTPVAIAHAMQDRRAQIRAIDSTSVEVQIGETNGTLDDQDVNVLVIGSDDSNEY